MEPQACFQELFPAIFFVSEGDDADQAAGKLLKTLEQRGIRLLNIDLGLGPFENRGDEGSLEMDAGDVRAGSLFLFRFFSTQVTSVADILLGKSRNKPTIL